MVLREFEGCRGYKGFFWLGVAGYRNLIFGLSLVYSRVLGFRVRRAFGLRLLRVRVAGF